MAFCQSPEAYDEAYEDFYESLDKLDKRLETNRFLFGDYITDSDVRAYVTLIRWDVSYFHNVGPVKKPIRDYKNIWGYLKELYAIPAFRHGSDPQVLALSRPGKKLGEVLFRGYNERILAKVDFEKLMADDGSRRTLSKTPDEVFLRHPEERPTRITQEKSQKPSGTARNGKTETRRTAYFPWMHRLIR